MLPLKIEKYIIVSLLRDRKKKKKEGQKTRTNENFPRSHIYHFVLYLLTRYSHTVTNSFIYVHIHNITTAQHIDTITRHFRSHIHVHVAIFLAK